MACRQSVGRPFLCDIVTEDRARLWYNQYKQTQGGIDMAGIRKKRRAYVEQRDCVACGCCVKVCPMNAIQIYRGLYSQVDDDKCVGCGRCAKECPATVIEIREVTA